MIRRASFSRFEYCHLRGRKPSGFWPDGVATLASHPAADQIAVSELTRTECCNYPLRHANFPLLRLYDEFFLRPDVIILPITSNVFRRATLIQAMHGFGTIDSIHLATAFEHGCQIFLTHDSRLSRCTDYWLRNCHEPNLRSQAAFLRSGGSGQPFPDPEPAAGRLSAVTAR